MVRRFTTYMWVCMVAFLVFATAASAAVGSLTQVTGTVAIIPQGERPRPAGVGDAVQEGDTVLTRAKSTAEVTFADGSIMRAASNSRVRITQYETGQNTAKGILNLFEGKVQNIVLRAAGFFGKNKVNRYEVHTPTAVCGVRGTEFFVSFIDGISQSAVKTGVVYAYSSNQPGDVREVKAGQSMVVVSPDKPPVVRPAVEDDLKLEDDGGDAGDDTAVDDNPPPPAQDTTGKGDEENKVSTGDTIDTPPSPPVADDTETTTTFSAALAGSVFSGTLGGGISDTTNTGTFTLSADYAGGATGAQQAAGSAGSGAFEGFVGGTTGSWNGLFTGIYVDADADAGYVYSLLPGTYTPPAPESTGGGHIDAEGAAWRTDPLGVATNPQSDISGVLSTVAGRLPELASLGAAGGTITAPPGVIGTETIGIATGNQRILSAWTIQTGGGTVSADLIGTDVSLLYGQKSTGSYYLLGYLAASDDGAGHVAIDNLNEVPLTYIDEDYIGAVSLWYRGTHDGVGSDYRSTGQGTYTLDRMRYGGTWSGAVGTLYTNDGGSLAEAGWDMGLFGGLKSPWDAAQVDFFVMGDYGFSAGTPDTAYILNSYIQGQGIDAQGDHDGALVGFSNGRWQSDGVFSGYTVMLTAAPDLRAGIMYGDLSGNWFDGAEMWSASGTLTSDVKATLSETDYLSQRLVESGSISGQFSSTEGGGAPITAGTIDGGLVMPSMLLTFWDGDTAGLGWGIYNFYIGDGNTYTRPGDGAYTNWTAALGGWTTGLDGTTVVDIVDPGGPMFFDAALAGTWTGDGAISGDLSGKWMTSTHQGTFAGPVFGQNAEEGGGAIDTGTWIASSVGTYTGQRLAWGGYLHNGTGYTGLVLNSGGYADPDGATYGAIGSLDTAPWMSGGTTQLTAMGVVSDISAPDQTHLFSLSIAGSDQWPQPDLLTDRRVIEGFALGLWQPGGSIADVVVTGIYAAGNGTVDGGGQGGLFLGTADGQWNDAIGTWTLAGEAGTPATFVADTGTVATYGAPGTFNGTQLYPEFNDGFSAAISVGTSLSHNLEFFASGATEPQTVPIGALHMVLAGGTFSRDPGTTALAAAMGGHAWFGSDYSGDEGYWRAEPSLLWTEDGVITGWLEGGYYLTRTHYGEIFGSITGLADAGDSGTWYAHVTGGWEGAPLDYSGDWGGETLYTNNAGVFEAAGTDPGLFGIVMTADDGYEIMARGTYTDDGEGGLASGFGGPYVMSTALENGTAVNTDAGVGRVGGHVAGLWMKAADGDHRGNLGYGETAAILAAPDGTVSLLTGETNGMFWELAATRSTGIWEAGALLEAAAMTVPDDYDVADAAIVTLAGTGQGAAGVFEGSPDSTLFAGMPWMTVQTVSYGASPIGPTEAVPLLLADSGGVLPYGVWAWHIGTDGDNLASYTVKPDVDANAGFIVGGSADFGTIGEDLGYWQAEIVSDWMTPGGSEDGIILGAVGGRYITRTHFGAMEGEFFGLYHDDTWDAAAAGYDGTWSGAATGTYQPGFAFDYSGAWGGGTLYQDTAGRLSAVGSDEGLFGLVANTDGNFDLIAMGTFTDDGAGAPYYVWQTQLAGTSVNDGSGAGVLDGFASGAWSISSDVLAEEGLWGFGAAVMLAADGTPGLVSNLGESGIFPIFMLDTDGGSGGFFGGISGGVRATRSDGTAGIWRADGILIPHAIDIPASYSGTDAAIGQWSAAGATGGLVGMDDGIYGGAVSADVIGFDTRFITYTDTDRAETVSLPFGVFSMTLGDGTFSGLGGNFSYEGIMGGQAQFGDRPVDAGYWFGLSFWDWFLPDGSDVGAIDGAVLGYYMNRTHIGGLVGNLSGSLTAVGTDEMGTYGSWSALSTGVYEAAAALTVSGDWGTGGGTLYENDGGTLMVAGADQGLFGLIDDSGDDMFWAMGAYSDSGAAGPYLWDSDLFGEPVAHEGTVTGYTVGVIIPETDFTVAVREMYGSAALVMLDLAAVPSVRLGYGELFGSAFATGADGLSGQWLTMGDPAAETVLLPEAFDAASAAVGTSALAGGGTMMGSFDSLSDPTVFGEVVSLETQFVTYNDVELGATVSLPAGVFNLALGGGVGANDYTGRPYVSGVETEMDHSGWTGVAGGSAQFGYGFEDMGYWMAGISGEWVAYSDDEGFIEGVLDGQYLTTTHVGIIGGNVFGLYNDEGTGEGDAYGTWAGVGAGVYRAEVALDYSGSIGGPQTNLYFNDSGYLTQGGDIDAAVGLVTVADGGVHLVGMGAFEDFAHGPSPVGDGGPYLWSVSITADAVNPYTSDGGVAGYSAGFWTDLDDGGIQGEIGLDAVAIVYASDNTVSLVQGPVTGEFFTTRMDAEGHLGFWAVDGDLAATDMSAWVPVGYDVSTAERDRGFIGFDLALAGRFVDGTENTIYGEGLTARTRFVNYYDEALDATLSLPFGVYNIKIGDGNYFTDKPTGIEGGPLWKSVMGAWGDFGASEFDEGVWIAEIVEGNWVDGGIDGTLLGTYLTLTHAGEMTGRFVGQYDEDALPLALGGGAEGTWAGLSVGTYKGVPLGFGGYWYGYELLDVDASDTGWADGYIGDVGSPFDEGASWMAKGSIYTSDPIDSGDIRLASVGIDAWAGDWRWLVTGGVPDTGDGLFGGNTIALIGEDQPDTGWAGIRAAFYGMFLQKGETGMNVGLLLSEDLAGIVYPLNTGASYENAMWRASGTLTGGSTVLGNIRYSDVFYGPPELEMAGETLRTADSFYLVGIDHTFDEGHWIAANAEMGFADGFTSQFVSGATLLPFGLMGIDIDDAPYYSDSGPGFFAGATVPVAGVGFPLFETGDATYWLTDLEFDSDAWGPSGTITGNITEGLIIGPGMIGHFEDSQVYGLYYDGYEGGGGWTARGLANFQGVPTTLNAVVAGVVDPSGAAVGVEGRVAASDTITAGVGQSAQVGLSGLGILAGLPESPWTGEMYGDITVNGQPGYVVARMGGSDGDFATGDWSDTAFTGGLAGAYITLEGFGSVAADLSGTTYSDIGFWRMDGAPLSVQGDRNWAWSGWVSGETDAGTAVAGIIGGTDSFTFTGPNGFLAAGIYPDAAPAGGEAWNTGRVGAWGTGDNGAFYLLATGIAGSVNGDTGGISGAFNALYLDAQVAMPLYGEWDPAVSAGGAHAWMSTDAAAISADGGPTALDMSAAFSLTAYRFQPGDGLMAEGSVDGISGLTFGEGLSLTALGRYVDDRGDYRQSAVAIGTYGGLLDGGELGGTMLDGYIGIGLTEAYNGGHLVGLFQEAGTGTAGVYFAAVGGGLYPSVQMLAHTGDVRMSDAAATLSGPAATVAVGTAVTGTGTFSPGGGEFLYISDGRLETLSYQGEDWGVFQALMGGTRTDDPAEGDVFDIAFRDAADAPDTFGSVAVSQLTEEGREITGAWARIGDLVPEVVVASGVITGTFNPNIDTFQYVAQGVQMTTDRYAALAATEAGRAVLASMNLPSWQVGMESMSGTMSVTGTDARSLTVNMDNVAFFSQIDGAAPTAWLTNDVTGSFTGAPQAADYVNMSGVNIGAGFVVENWTASQWGASVVDGTGTVGGHDVSGFHGVAAGTVDSAPTDASAGTFSGAGAGAVPSQAP